MYIHCNYVQFLFKGEKHEQDLNFRPGIVLCFINQFALNVGFMGCIKFHEKEKINNYVGLPITRSILYFDILRTVQYR